ncbi:MAG: type I restriction-modification system subunit M [Ureaplasma sp.]|nr:type I restriction-modification system subunit M [Ureaplasma sp.]
MRFRWSTKSQYWYFWRHIWIFNINVFFKCRKVGGEFYTPQQVSKLLAHLCLDFSNTKPKNAYDPTCGSSSLLLQVDKIFKTKYPDESIYLAGQENILITYQLSKMNMFLHGINYSNFDIQYGDTLLDPKHINQKFDVIVSNPPYSIPWDIENKPTLINDERYSGPGVLAPKTKADFAFILHTLYQLSDIGCAAIICFPGIFYRSGVEAKIRQYLIDMNYVQALIALPNNLFFGTSIDTVVLVLKKNKTNNDVLFINASDFYNKITNKNDLSDKHIQQILDIYSKFSDCEFSKVVSNEIIKNNNYDLSVNKYIPKIVEKEEIDIKQLNEEIKNISDKNQQLRFDIESLIKEIENE